MVSWYDQEYPEVSYWCPGMFKGIQRFPVVSWDDQGYSELPPHKSRRQWVI